MAEQQNPHPQDDLSKLITRAASQVDDFIDIRWRRLKGRLGWEGVPQIQPYIGYGNRERVWLHGRVLTNPPPAAPGEDDQWWENIAKTYRRFASDEVPDCPIEVSLGEHVQRSQTDAEGYFHFEIPLPAETAQGTWGNALLRIVDHPRVTAEQSATSCRYILPGRDAEFGLISDVDDTILHTNATRLLTMARLTFTGNARTRLPLAGAAALYQKLNNEGRNPAFYVSSSPWNLFDLLEDFMELNQIPAGPILLRDLGFDDDKFLKSGHDHKLVKVRRLLNAYPDLPFIPFGDSGQEDARLYTTAAEEFPDRILAIFIRDIDPHDASLRDASVKPYLDRTAAVEVPM